jgi:hypothetical protein
MRPRPGASLARCQIRLGAHFGGGITFFFNTNLDNSANESLSVEAGEQALFLNPRRLSCGGPISDVLDLIEAMSKRRSSGSWNRPPSRLPGVSFRQDV